MPTTTDGLVWTKTPSDAWSELAEAYASAIHAGMWGIAQARAPEISNWMKENAPWTDRTGNARQTLHTAIQQTVNEMVTIILAHGVDYGIYLELKNAGRFAVVTPAIDHFGPIIWGDVKEMLRS